MTDTRRSAVSELRRLPEVFDLSTFSRLLGLERSAAQVYVSRWAKADLIKPAGPRAGVYFNLVRAPDSPDRCAADAVRLLYPSAILIGASVLHAAGWTNQVPQRTTVAAMSRPTFVQLDGFDISPRPRRWYARVLPRLSDDPNLAAYGFKSLTPALALADSLSRDDGWRPDPDDLDLDDADPEELREAFERLGVEEPDWMPRGIRP